MPLTPFNTAAPKCSHSLHTGRVTVSEAEEEDQKLLYKHRRENALYPTFGTFLYITIVISIIVSITIVVVVINVNANIFYN